MSEMVERVARATYQCPACEGAGEILKSDDVHMLAPGSRKACPTCFGCGIDIRQQLEALMEPTEEMVEAGVKEADAILNDFVGPDEHDYVNINPETIKSVLNAMITVVLGEG